MNSRHSNVLQARWSSGNILVDFAQREPKSALVRGHAVSDEVHVSNEAVWATRACAYKPMSCQNSMSCLRKLAIYGAPAISWKVSTGTCCDADLVTASGRVLCAKRRLARARYERLAALLARCIPEDARSHLDQWSSSEGKLFPRALHLSVLSDVYDMKQRVAISDRQSVDTLGHFLPDKVDALLLKFGVTAAAVGGFRDVLIPRLSGVL